MTSSRFDPEYMDSLGLDAEAAHKATTLDQGDLAGEMCRVVSDLAYWGHLAAQYAGTARMSKIALADTEAQAYRAAMSLAVPGPDGKSKAPSADKIKAATASMPLVLQAKRAHAADQERADVARAIVDAIAAKASLVQSLGALVRAEMGLQR